MPGHQETVTGAVTKTRTGLGLDWDWTGDGLDIFLLPKDGSMIFHREEEWDEAIMHEWITVCVFHLLIFAFTIIINITLFIYTLSPCNCSISIMMITRVSQTIGLDTRNYNWKRHSIEGLLFLW